MNTSLHVRIEEAAAVISRRLPEIPEVAVVLGSGLGGVADRLEDRTSMPYEHIPHFARATAPGHRGELVLGKTAEGDTLLALQGRFHYYEGNDLETVTFPIRVLRALGIRTLMLTAATGAIRKGLAPGTIACLSDHINLLGANPLRGPNDERLGVRFPDLSDVYSRHLRRIAREAAGSLGFELPEVVYACISGPSYETPAEVAMLAILGADVVGMSTVPEAIVARHSGLEVLAFAVITNWAAGIAAAPIHHNEVVEIGARVEPSLEALLYTVVQRWKHAHIERKSAKNPHPDTLGPANPPDAQPGAGSPDP